MNIRGIGQLPNTLQTLITTDVNMLSQLLNGIRSF